MRVIQLGPFPPPHGGVQTNLVNIRDHLRRHGHGAAVIHLTRHRRENADEVFYPKSALETAKLLLTEPADILHLHIGGNLAPRLLALCLFCSLIPGRKSVLTFHSGGFCSSPEGQATGPDSRAAKIFRRLDAVIAVNAEIETFFLRIGIPRERVHLIPPHAAPGADAELPPPIRRFFDAHDPVLLSVGLLEHEYDLPLQIRALGLLRESHPNAGLVMIGSGALEADLRAIIAAQPYAEHLLLPGDVPHPSTLRAIRESSALLRTTHFDGDSISVREALQLGTPVIATDNGMRPAGVRLIPGPQPPTNEIPMEPLLAAIGNALAATAPAHSVASAGTANPNTNLDAVLALYRQLLGR